VSVALLIAGALLAAEPPPAPPPAAAETAPAEEAEPINDSAGYTPPLEGPGAPSALTTGGYVDVGFAHAGGDGTSFPAGDLRLPADYGVDTFAPAVNSRGDVASTDAGGRFVNGFLPRSVGIGGRPSPLVNTVDVDLKYAAPAAPLTVFVRLQALPRFSPAGDESRLFVEQAFGRIVPFEALELAIAAGKFDSVFGIEYLDNQANIRTGITPSLIARYTTGQSVGGKVFYRLQMAPIWSALSLNLAATTSGNFVEALQPPDASLTGVPVGSGRLGYELNLPLVQVKLGGSAMFGPRNDQHDPAAHQRAVGGDLRVALFGIYLSAEVVRVDEDAGGPKTTSLGSFPLSSAFHARGGYGQLAWAAPVEAGPLRKLTPYARYELRHAWFEGYTPITVDRITAGVRVDLWESLIVKGELLFNRERAGAPSVPNNVQTTSVVYTW
jgi:hypothetical protein